MGSRSRKRGRRNARERPAERAPGSTLPPENPDDALRRGYSRSRERDDRVRAGLQPLAPGERPPALLVAVGVSGLLGLSNVVLFILGVEVQGERPDTAGTLLFSVILLAAAAGMWLKRYWALLGFQALLALMVLVFSLFLLRASNVLGAVVCIVLVGAAGWLFFKLVRVLSRVQMPERRRPPPVG